jgi:transposase
VELLVSQDGGVPLVRQSWDGHASDTQIFQERAEALMATLQRSLMPRYLVADAKLDTEEHAATRSKLGCITRIPGTLKLVSQVLTPTLEGDTWPRLDDTTRYEPIELCPYGMAQRGLVVSSQAALERAEASVNKACQRDAQAIDKQLFHLPARRFEPPEAAHAALAALAQAWKYHRVETARLIEHRHYAGTGRPTPITPIKALDWQRPTQGQPEHERLAYRKQQEACFVIGTNIDAHQLGEAEVMHAYNAQAQAEGGFRFLKAPLFFVSSLFVKQPCRIQGLLMVMTLALLVYSVTQRRLRQQRAWQNETIPHQINQPTERPTLRGVFQRLEGIHRVRGTLQDRVHDLIEGLNEVQSKILRLFGAEVCRLYQISPG